MAMSHGQIEQIRDETEGQRLSEVDLAGILSCYLRDLVELLVDKFFDPRSQFRDVLPLKGLIDQRAQTPMIGLILT